MSFTAQYARRKGIVVLDEIGESIPSFKKIANEIDYSKFKPHLPFKVIDKTNISKIKVDISKTEILRFHTDVERYGYAIISVKTSLRWRKRQQVEYKLAPLYAIPARGMRMNYFPLQHQVRFDPITRRIRLEGPNVRDINKRWMPIKEK